MKNMNVYTVYLDYGKGYDKLTIPAESEKAARKFVEGNGTVVAVIKNERETSLVDIDTHYLAETLERNAWGQEEIDVIVRVLEQVGLER